MAPRHGPRSARVARQVPTITNAFKDLSGEGEINITGTRDVDNNMLTIPGCLALIGVVASGVGAWRSLLRKIR